MRLSSILDMMQKEAGKRHAPVFRIENAIGKDPFKILIFTMLSSRTRDTATIKAAKKLFSLYKNVRELAKADITKVKKLIYGVAFFRQKAIRVVGIARHVSTKGVPKTFEAMIKLPGVGRKTANVVLAVAFKKDTIGVDVHLHRIANRLGLVKTTKPEQTELALKKVFPKKLWKKVNISFVSYGQTICRPVNPLCGICRLNRICRYYSEWSKHGSWSVRCR
jgi:endonuclease-3